MSVTGNIESIDLDLADLSSRFPALDLYRPTDSYDWSLQIGLGKELALRRFREMREQFPDRARAQNDEDWVHIAACYTLAVILGGNVQPELISRSERFYEEADTALGQLIYDYDEDDDGEIDKDTSEERQRNLTIHLVRG